MNTANTIAVTVELITTCWAPLISCPCQQDLPSAKNYPYTCTTSTFAGCLGARNTGHICMCLYVSDIIFWGTHLQSPASAPIFCRFAIVIWNDLNIFQFRAKGAFGVHPMIWSKMCRREFRSGEPPKSRIRVGFGFRVSIGPGEVKSSESVSGFGFWVSQFETNFNSRFRVSGSLIETNSADLSPDHVSPPDAFFVHMTCYGSNLGLHKVGRLKMI